jgi:hypothetical protein
MAEYTVRKAIFFTKEQAEALDRLSRLPQYEYNSRPSEGAVVREAVTLFLQQLSTVVDDNQKQTA